MKSILSLLLDYQLQSGRNMKTGDNWTIQLPKSNVLQFILEDGSKISARPSGTEPKIKFYFSVHTALAETAAYERVEQFLRERIKGIITDMGLK